MTSEPVSPLPSIRPAVPSDAAAIADIYNHYVTQTIVTFEDEPVAATEMARRMEDVRASSFPWLVAEEGGRVVGYAYAAPWRTRSAYRGGSMSDTGSARSDSAWLRILARDYEAHMAQIGQSAALRVIFARLYAEALPAPEC